MVFVLGTALLVLALTNPTLAFVPIGGGTATHVTITGNALLQKVTEACKAVANAAGHEFEPTGSSPEELVKACLGPTATGEVSGAKFHAALQEIYTQNGLVDRDFVNSAPHHFNSESFLEGRALIIEGLATIKSNIRLENFKAARETLGRILHVLQDFYSHSNWVELGNVEPFSNLLRADLPLENLAEVNTPTCSDCESGTCPNPILYEILQQKKLTSGYMGIFSNAKPKGKCSHGGASDLTSAEIPRGGINKDVPHAHNSGLHRQAVNVATFASLELLEDIRAAAGDKDFLRMMGIARSSVVCFVIDTTGSMWDDIVQAQKLVYEIIDSKKGTQDEPSEYILVPFNDPSFGPMVRTTDPDKMKKEVSSLHPFGGGDDPELCLSGLQLALTGAPASSNIYVFTDATAKDIHLKDTIAALIRSTKSTVTFLLTGAGAGARRRRSLRAGSFQDYKDLALASGGQAIQVTKSQLPQATDVILDTSTSALVTVLQRARSPGNEETFPFVLDESLQNITIYITGAPRATPTFTLTNPSGVNQTQNEVTGELGTVGTVGNLQRIRLNPDKKAGTWTINIKSTQPYTLKVTGQSTITFIYDFVERFEGPHPGYAVVSGRPQAGQPALLMLSVMGTKGPTSLNIKEVGLVTVSSPEIVSNSIITEKDSGDILVEVDAVPDGEFVILVKGTDQETKSEFQRQSTTQMSVSKVNIKAVVSSTVEPGKTLILPFSITTEGTNGTYDITANNDKNFSMTYPKSLMVKAGEPTKANLSITSLPTTPSGTDVTLTIDVKSSSVGADSNYVVLRLSVVEKITDFVAPLCNVYDVMAGDCPDDVSKCGLFKWHFTANLTDNNGTGIDQISLRQGNGNLTYTSLSDPLVQAKYEASCCSQTAEFVALDKVGNVGKCYHSIVKDFDPPQCQLVRLVVDGGKCPNDLTYCRDHKWELVVNLTDGNGTGLKGISLHHGDGILIYSSLNSPVTEVSYNATCCAQVVDFRAVDKAGNEGRCYYSIVSSAGPLTLSVWLLLAAALTAML
ncbi:von Willebrand factor A domain-containing protein 7 [Takifugu rubripes]|uniref:von Willebrand factor A domain-containing protein 7 n=1 Tax=Takifugu rubripes TaxID=31033 RepID=UPI001145EF93|nr:von Willebrand factor A domain-containing protein 7-like [Takifugu rubripes]